MKKSKKMDLAVHEYFTAIQLFASAMEAADISYMAKTMASYPMTMRMSEAFARFIEACRRIQELSESR